MSTAMGGLSCRHWRKKEGIARKKHLRFSGSCLKLLSYSIDSISCIVISNQRTSFLITGKSNWETLGFVRAWSLANIWLRLCLAHLSTWRRRSSKEKIIQQKLIYGHLELFYMRCYSEYAHTKASPSLCWSAPSTRTIFPCHFRSIQSARRLKPFSKNYWQKITFGGSAGSSYSATR